MPECEITVARKSDKRSRGVSGSKFVTGPISQFFRDDEVLYQAVWSHVKSCDKCDPNYVLQGFLDNRNTEKKQGKTTYTLFIFVQKYIRKFGAKINQDIIKAYAASCLDPRPIVECQNLFELEEVLMVLSTAQHSQAAAGTSRAASSVHIPSDLQLSYVWKNAIDLNLNKDGKWQKQLDMVMHYATHHKLPQAEDLTQAGIAALMSACHMHRVLNP